MVSPGLSYRCSAFCMRALHNSSAPLLAVASILLLARGQVIRSIRGRRYGSSQIPATLGPALFLRGIGRQNQSNRVHSEARDMPSRHGRIASAPKAGQVEPLPEQWRPQLSEDLPLCGRQAFRMPVQARVLRPQIPPRAARTHSSTWSAGRPRISCQNRIRFASRPRHRRRISHWRNWSGSTRSRSQVTESQSPAPRMRAMTKSRSAGQERSSKRWVVPEQVPHRLGQSRLRLLVPGRRTQAVQRVGQPSPLRLGERGRRLAEKAHGPGVGGQGPGDLGRHFAGEREEGLGGDGQEPADALDGDGHALNGEVC